MLFIQLQYTTLLQKESRTIVNQGTTIFTFFLEKCKLSKAEMEPKIYLQADVEKVFFIIFCYSGHTLFQSLHKLQNCGKKNRSELQKTPQKLYIQHLTQKNTYTFFAFFQLMCMNFSAALIQPKTGLPLKSCYNLNCTFPILKAKSFQSG